MVTDDLKVAWTSAIAAFERAPAAARVQRGPSLKDELDRAPRWTDSSRGIFSAGWDTYQNLQGRLARARSEALAAHGFTSTGARVSTAGAGTEGVAAGFVGALGDELVAGAGTVSRLGEGLGSAARAVGNLGEGLEGWSRVAVPALLVGAGLYFAWRAA